MEKRPAAPRFDASSAVNSDDPRLVAAVREFMAALEKGTAPSRQEFLERHREIAADLSICLDGLEMVHSAAVRVRRRPTPPPLLGGVNASQPLGDFQIVREIGRGGMGVVYEAFQLSLGRRVALKVLPFAASLDPSRLERFRNEAQAAAQLHHSNIVPVYSVGIDRGVHFYAMQLIDGQPLSYSIVAMRRSAGRADSNPSATTPLVSGSVRRKSADFNLAELSSSRTPASAIPGIEALNVETGVGGSTVLSLERSKPGDYFRTVARLMHQAATALEHAHAMGVVHRDIKPGNLLLDQRNNLWITDFGLAQFHSDAELTRTGDLLGTLRYMSPEQAAGGRVLLDHRTDVYSLGATMYEVLTLEPIFEGGDRNVLLRRIMEDEPRAPRSIEPKVPVELETIVLKATAKMPGDRYATAQQFAEDLQRWLDDKPILARRPALAERVRRWSRRHRTVVRAAAIVLCLGMMGLAASAIVIAREHARTAAAYRNEIKQREAAEASFQQARQAIDTFTELSEEELASKPSLQQLRRKFLEKSLEYYKAFLKQRGSDRALNSELTAASARVARIVDELALLDQLAPLMLLDDPQVQDELNIAVDRRSEIESVLTQLWEERERARGTNHSAAAAPQASVTEELRSHGEKLFALLSQQQIGRLKQIAWQQQGAAAFQSPDVAAALKLSAEERIQINQIIERRRPPGPPDHGVELSDPGRSLARDEAGAEFGRLHDGPPPGPRRDREPFPVPPLPPPGNDGPPERDDPIDRLPDETPDAFHERHTIELILAVLTPQQRADWKNLVGDPFLPHHPGGRPDRSRRPD